MIDAKLILRDKAYVKRELAAKGFDQKYIDALEMFMLRAKAEKNSLNELCEKRNKEQRDPAVSTDEKRKLRERISNARKDLRSLEYCLQSALYKLPNFPDPEAPVGSGGADNVIVYQSKDHYTCQVENPEPHWDVAARLGILDTGLAGEISGSGFALFKGKGAKLQRALVNYGLSLHEDKYFEILPPHLVTTEALTQTGHLPKFEDDLYKCENDDLWLIPTAEVPLTAMLAGTVFPKGSLPKRYMGYTLSFRREAGASGRETRGLQRVHEFHKVELLKITEPSMVQAELDDLLEDCLRIIKDLKLRYRIVDLCTGDMGDKYARCFDIEVFSPGIGEWLEVSSAGHFSDYQARRADIKYVDENGKKRLAYTLNGSGIATARVWLSLIETYQQPDGSVLVPDVLRPFMGCDRI